MSGSDKQVSLPLNIPEKLYFKIGEVAKITGLKPYVLRYWETEFPSIRPAKSKTNQRVYQRKDIETILLIKKLLYEEKFTIEGARTRLKELKSGAAIVEALAAPTTALTQVSGLEDLKAVRSGLGELLSMLNEG